MMVYGKELILDLHFCNVDRFNRTDITNFFIQVCEEIDMERCDLHFWDDEGVAPEDRQTDPKTKGISAIQFIITSNITIHTLDLLERVYLNVFSCKDFDSDIVALTARGWFGGKIVNSVEITRK